MNIVAIKKIKKVNTGLTKKGTPYVNTFFIGTLEDGSDLPISTFDKIEPSKVYEMELIDEEYEGKTYHKASVKSEFKKESPKPPPPQPANLSGYVQTTPDDLEEDVYLRVSAINGSLKFYEKAQGITVKDIKDTAQIFYEFYRNMTG